MMQEVVTDSNGDSTYDFVADAKQSDSGSLTQSFSSTSSGFSGVSTPVPTSNPTFITEHLSASAPKPSYEYPPGMAPANLATNRLPGEAPKAPIAPLMFPPHFKPPASTVLPSFTSAVSLMRPPTQEPQLNSSKPSTGPDLNEIFGADVMANLPPLNASISGSVTSKFPSPISQISSHLPSPTSTPSIVSTLPLNLPKIPNMPPTSGVNPFSSQAAGSHLPSFSGLLSSHPSTPNNAILSTTAFIPQVSAPAPVGLFSIPAAVQALPPPAAVYSSPPQQFQESGTNYPVSFPYDQSPAYPSSTMSVIMGTPGAYPNQLHSGSGYSHAAGRSWWAQTSLDTLKNVTEKAKSTVYSLMTTLDPQMKLYSVGESGQLSGDLTMFYIGNELSMISILRSGLESVYKNLHIYTRSGVAPGHKLQIGFANALTTANMTLQLAQTAPPIQNSILFTVEPFVVELSPSCWYASSCLVLSDAPKAANLHIFSQLTPLPDGLLSFSGEQKLPAPLDELVMRNFTLAEREIWMEQLTGVSWGATVALAARQLFGIHRRRYP